MISDLNKSSFGYYFLADILEWIQNNLSPEDVFRTIDLIEWAENNGYVEEEDE